MKKIQKITHEEDNISKVYNDEHSIENASKTYNENEETFAGMEFDVLLCTICIYDMGVKTTDVVEC